jgi:hypothetical protein
MTCNDVHTVVSLVTRPHGTCGHPAVSAQRQFRFGLTVDDVHRERAGAIASESRLRHMALRLGRYTLAAVVLGILRYTDGSIRGSGQPVRIETGRVRGVHLEEDVVAPHAAIAWAAWYPFGPLFRRSRCPEIVRLGDLRVGIDDCDAIHDVSNLHQHGRPPASRLRRNIYRYSSRAARRQSLHTAPPHRTNNHRRGDALRPAAGEELRAQALGVFFAVWNEAIADDDSTSARGCSTHQVSIFPTESSRGRTTLQHGSVTPERRRSRCESHRRRARRCRCRGGW